MKVAEVKIMYSTKVKSADRTKINNSASCDKILRPYFEDTIEHKESFYIMMLNIANQVLGITKISEGGISGTVADGKLIFQAALLANASAIIIAHNHPSGQLKPSQSDKDLTKKFREFGKLIDLQILDHLILTKDGYYSFADDNLFDNI